MRVSVVIATYNRKDSLLRCLAAVSRLDYPDYEIIVVDDGSTDGSAEAARRAFPQARFLVYPTNKGEPTARNRGILAVTGSIVAFTDDDCLPPRDWLQKHVRYYDDPQIAAVGGPQVCRSPSFFDKFDMANYAVKFHRLETIDSIQRFEHLLAGNMSVRRAAIERVGGFDERLVTGCDADFIRRLSRAGYRFVRDPNIEVDHLKTYEFGSFLRMRFHRGCGSVLTDVKEGTLRLRRFFPIVNPIGVWAYWRDFRKAFGGGPALFTCFCAFAQLTRWVDVAGRAYYYWTVGRRLSGTLGRVADPMSPEEVNGLTLPDGST